MRLFFLELKYYLMFVILNIVKQTISQLKMFHKYYNQNYYYI